MVAKTRHEMEIFTTKASKINKHQWLLHLSGRANWPYHIKCKKIEKLCSNSHPFFVCVCATQTLSHLPVAMSGHADSFASCLPPYTTKVCLCLSKHCRVTCETTKRGSDTVLTAFGTCSHTGSCEFNILVTLNSNLTFLGLSTFSLAIFSPHEFSNMYLTEGHFHHFWRHFFLWSIKHRNWTFLSTRSDYFLQYWVDCFLPCFTWLYCKKKWISTPQSAELKRLCGYSVNFNFSWL